MKWLALSIVLILGLSAVGSAQETSGNFTGGSIKIGYDSRICVAGLAGSLRYNSSGSASVEVCDGSNWTIWGN